MSITNQGGDEYVVTLPGGDTDTVYATDAGSLLGLAARSLEGGHGPWAYRGRTGAPIFGGHRFTPEELVSFAGDLLQILGAENARKGDQRK